MSEIQRSEKANLRMHRIQRVIKIVRFLLSSSIILTLVVGSLFLADLAGFSLIPQGVKLSFSPLLTYASPFKIPEVVLCLGFVRVALFLAGALILFWWLDLVEGGQFFVGQSVRHIKWLGYLVITDWAVTKLLDAMAHSGVELSFGKLLLGLLIVLVAWVMDEGRQIKEEQELTV
jgi:hypothetical protein